VHGGYVELKHHVGLTIDAKLFREIETIRGREKRSTFVEHLLKLGLETYSKNPTHEDFNIRKNQTKLDVRPNLKA
jgi:hypothetical protein